MKKILTLLGITGLMMFQLSLFFNGFMFEWALTSFCIWGMVFVLLVCKLVGAFNDFYDYDNLSKTNVFKKKIS